MKLSLPTQMIFFSEEQKLQMIQNTVPDVPELSHVQANADLDEAKGDDPITYSQYTSLLILLQIHIINRMVIIAH
jgi:hypothetical protein